MSEFDRDEANRFWNKMHSHGPTVDTAADPDLLEVVCHPGMPPWFNRYVARIQRRAFFQALDQLGSITGRRVVEVGCGSGRWSRTLASRGADVLATDLSSTVIERNRTVMPGIEFAAGDFLELDLPSTSFDGLVSVTVIQHFPPDAQERAIDRIGDLLKPGGFALLLENTHDRGAHVFGRSITDWRASMERRDLRLTWAKGYEFDYPLRIAGTLARVLRSLRPSPEEAGTDDVAEQPEAMAGDMFVGGQKTAKTLLYGPAVLAAYPLEPLSAALLPNRLATHAAMLFRKT